MNCPQCAGVLSSERHHGIEIDACGDCSGLWFDRGELERYWQSAQPANGFPPVDRSRFIVDPDGALLACPRCASNTLALTRVDVFEGGACSRCLGVWLVPARVDFPERGQMKLDVGGGTIAAALDIAAELLSFLSGRR